ncbi:hypothetical protein B0H65DRAFT_551583 [Neurospora tetraspora]|uniref:Uncharacterized protein n=1 Tax=Neurospora tetraspora TaxID=94610 RepID=A0AAE0J838_9PEZI|nr:hypothetical protein B0H65DRAFT_551583 [Neurospora tetraspora]
MPEATVTELPETSDRTPERGKTPGMHMGVGHVQIPTIVVPSPGGTNRIPHSGDWSGKKEEIHPQVKRVRDMSDLKKYILSWDWLAVLVQPTRLQGTTSILTHRQVVYDIQSIPQPDSYPVMLLRAQYPDLHDPNGWNCRVTSGRLGNAVDPVCGQCIHDCSRGRYPQPGLVRFAADGFAQSSTASMAQQLPSPYTSTWSDTSQAECTCLVWQPGTSKCSGFEHLKNKPGHSTNNGYRNYTLSVGGGRSHQAHISWLFLQPHHHSDQPPEQLSQRQQLSQPQQLSYYHNGAWANTPLSTSYRGGLDGAEDNLDLALFEAHRSWYASVSEANPSRSQGSGVTTARTGSTANVPNGTHRSAAVWDLSGYQGRNDSGYLPSTSSNESNQGATAPSTSTQSFEQPYAAFMAQVPRTQTWNAAPSSVAAPALDGNNDSQEIKQPCPRTKTTLRSPARGTASFPRITAY